MHLQKASAQASELKAAKRQEEKDRLDRKKQRASLREDIESRKTSRESKRESKRSKINDFVKEQKKFTKAETTHIAEKNEEEQQSPTQSLISYVKQSVTSLANDVEHRSRPNWFQTTKSTSNRPSPPHNTVTSQGLSSPKTLSLKGVEEEEDTLLPDDDRQIKRKKDGESNYRAVMSTVSGMIYGSHAGKHHTRKADTVVLDTPTDSEIAPTEVEEKKPDSATKEEEKGGEDKQEREKTCILFDDGRAKLKKPEEGKRKSCCVIL